MNVLRVGAETNAGAVARADVAPAVVRVDHVTAGYDGRPAIDDVSVTIGAGSLIAILGPNGGGKSTLLKVIAGLLRPWRGEVEVLGGPPGREAHRVAYVPQAELVDWSFPVSVWDVVMMGRYPRLGAFRRTGSEDRDRVEQALVQVGMTSLSRTQIGSLSGGQRRRAFLARALAADPDLYLLDEPVTGVDVTTQEELVAILADRTRAGKTVLASTHDLGAAAHHFAQVIAVNRTLIAAGPASLVLDLDVLSRTFGGHLLELRGRTVILDDAHHHDSEAPGEPHHHHDEGIRQ